MKARNFSKLTGLITAAALTFQLAPFSAVFAENNGVSTKFSFSDEKILVTGGSYDGYKISGTDLTINSAGTYEVSGSCSDGSITVKKGTADVVLILDGLTLSNPDSSPISFNKSTDVTLYAKDGSVNNLSDAAENNDDSYPDNQNAENAVIKCKDGSNVVITGGGTINITANGKNGIKSGESTEEDGNASLTFDGANINIDAPVNDAVNAQSTLTVKSGKLKINAADDALHSDYDLIIGSEDSAESPEITIESCYEGLEGANIKIYSGNIEIHSDDDGINAANSDLSGYAFTLDIYGGNIYVDAKNGDGIDSNGTLTVHGGNLEIFSTSSGANSPLDSDGTFTITGGEVLAVGNSGMAQNPASGSQNFISFGERAGGAMGQGGNFTNRRDDRSVIKGGTDTENGGINKNAQNGENSGKDIPGPVQPSADPSESDGAQNGNTPGNFRGGMGSDNRFGMTPPEKNNGGTPPENAPGINGSAETAPGQNENSAQNGISISNGDTLTITDSSGNVLKTASAVRNANYVFYSAGDLSDSETYTLKCGNTVLRETSVSQSAQNGGFSQRAQTGDFSKPGSDNNAGNNTDGNIPDGKGDPANSDIGGKPGFGNVPGFGNCFPYSGGSFPGFGENIPDMDSVPGMGNNMQNSVKNNTGIGISGGGFRGAQSAFQNGTQKL